MKILLLIISLFIFTSSEIYSQENFEYPLGDSLYQHWSSTGPIFIGPYKRILITTPTLTFPSYTGSNLGYSAMLDTVDTEILKKSFDFFGASSGSVYTSFIVRVGAARPGGGRFINIGGSQFENFYYNSSGGVFVKDSAGKMAFGIAKHNETPVYTPAAYNRATNYLIIHKYTYVSGADNNDSLSLFVFSDECPYDEPEPNVRISPSGTDFPPTGTVWLYQKVNLANSPRLKIDGIGMEFYWNNSLLPVELASFSASVNKSDVVLNWTTNSETNNSCFEIERKNSENSEQENWQKAGYINGAGNSGSPVDYFFTDKSLQTGNYLYRLKQIDFNGNFKYYDLSQEIKIGIPDKYELSQNYPNPFNPSTSINYSIPEIGNVSIRIYDISGSEIYTLMNEQKPAGYHSIIFDASNLSSGTYFYNLTAGDFSEVKKMVLLK